MKLLDFFAIGAASCISAAAQTGAINGRAVPLTNILTNILAIYLAADRDVALTNHADLTSLKLEPTPALSDRDFVVFNTNSHCITITAEAAKRLNLRVKREKNSGGGYVFDWPDTLFVMEAFGDRVYCGIFSIDLPSVISSANSSLTYFEDPVVKPMLRFIGANDTNNVTFCIGTPLNVYDFRREFDRAIWEIETKQFRETNAGSVNRKAQNAPHWAPDARNDPRIIAAVQKLFSDRKR